MQFHYALVDDLFSREEFERRIEAKMEACGDLVDEVTAAMMVVQDCGRHHVKIKDLSGRSTLFSFFGKVIARNPPREFERPGGEKGLVTSIILGDETGQVRAILWDEKAIAGQEIAIGDVLEVIGRHPARSASEITVMAMRQSMVEIVGPTQVEPSLAPPKRKEITVTVMAISDPRMVQRRDGTEGEMRDLIVGIVDGITRMVCWSPGLLDGITEGMTLRIHNALEKVRKAGREFSIDEKSEVEVIDEEVPVRLDTFPDAKEGSTLSVAGSIRSCQPAHTFTTKDGRASCVRNLVITDGEHDLHVVLWGEHAGKSLVSGEQVTLYLVSAKIGRSGELELHAGRGSFIQVQNGGETVEEEISGTVLLTPEGTFLDTSDGQYVVLSPLPHGHEIRAKVRRAGKRLTILSWEENLPDPAELDERLDALISLTGNGNTFAPHGRQDING
ncbi:MAG: Replication factor A [Methanoregulaceae archaeon PtaB.Bin108]|nr:MAG: Replication factor A [Methanoregulaceae archaeon PtaB.Bin108]OPY40230.1 MAG: Replication factor A [Methanoregulaceae archaeon PtaU1.Bin222]